MYVKSSIFVVNFFMLLIRANSQGIDTDFCNINTIQGDPANLPIPVYNLTSRYQAVIEKNIFLGQVGTQSTSEEIVEYYDGLFDIGIARQRAGAQRVTSYSYYKTNELLLIQERKCITLKLNESYGITPFLIFNSGDKELVATPLTLAIVPGIKFVYIGTDFVRGIPVNQWKTCLFDDKLKVTYKVTMSFSNPDKWIPAAPSPAYPSIPIQADVMTKNAQTGRQSSESNSFFEFRPYLLLEEEDYFTPSGIYCPGRLNLKVVPKVPSTFGFSVQQVQPYGFGDLVGTISQYREEYNYDQKLFRFDYDKNNTLFSEVHDYNTGLNYITDRKTGKCRIDILAPDQIDSQSSGNYVQMRDPAAFFDFDNVPYQYVGLKRVDGVNTNVWIGPKTIDGYNATFEWYFLSETWNRTDIPEPYRPPILVIIRVFFPDAQNPGRFNEITTLNHIFNFYTSGYNSFEYNVGACTADLDKQQFQMIISDENRDSIKTSMIQFRQSLILALKQIAKVTIIRITRVEVIDVKDFIAVRFILVEKAKKYGNVPVPSEDLALEDAKKALKDFNENNRIEIKYKDHTDKEIVIYVDQNSLTETHDYGDGFVHLEIQTVDDGYSSGAVAAVTIVFILIGIVVSLLLITLHKFKKINLPFLR